MTIRYRTKLHHIGVGRQHKGTEVLLLVDGLDIRVITWHGELLRRLTLDPSKDYQATGRPPGPPRGVTDHTVKTQVTRIYEKLEVRNRVDL